MQIDVVISVVEGDENAALGYPPDLRGTHQILLLQYADAIDQSRLGHLKLAPLVFAFVLFCAAKI